MKSKRLLIVVYDGVANSVFESLVLEPARKRIERGDYAHIDIISFEANAADAQRRVRQLSSHGISFVILKKIPFVGRLTLFLQAPSLARQLSTGWYEAVIARGPLAGYIVKMALTWFTSASQIPEDFKVTIQARGLAAEEARLAFEIEAPRSFFRRVLLNIRIGILKGIEKSVYDVRTWSCPRVNITAVSDALRAYLIGQFSAVPETVSVDDSDRIVPIEASVVRGWRRELRDFLKIPQSAVVYGYSGSYKPWQCAEETVAFIASKIKDDPNAYGIILSTDVVPFQALISRMPTDKSRFFVRYVPSHEILQWLSICDFGMLLRYEDVVNWVSRPTKALEYHAVGLSVVHNNTIKWLMDCDARQETVESEITPHPKHVSPS